MSRIRPGRPVFNFRNDYTVTAVDTSTWLQISASLPLDMNLLEVFDSSGQVMEIAIGPAGLESRQFLVMPGGNSQPVNIGLNKGMRVAVRAVSATANSGQLVINGYA